ncbi:Zinc finger DNA binding protein [Operophtera brumata]|uniref:Zinc finger DNA binding protein n=1 Tax=Operophtera brumata TaxID=104452 RepID=A0A0L7LEV3_OPEBR|nr:Zinc finger DNA binding protein [Operophtera brumata]
MTSQYGDLLARVSSLEKDNIEYKERVSTLENKLELLDKHACGSTIEIRNIPKQINKSKQVITKIVKDIGLALNLEAPIQDAEVRDIHRSKSEAIVVEFTCVSKKESIVAGYKKLNKDRRENKEQQLNTTQINLPEPPRVIYISEFLTLKARHLFYIARESVKNKKLLAAWTSYGKVLVKKEEGATPVRIDEEEDLFKLVI